MATIKKAEAGDAPAKKKPAAKKKGFPPPSIKLSGDLTLAATFPDGKRLLLLHEHARGQLTLLTEGDRIYKPVRLAIGSELFPPRDPRSETTDLAGVAVVEHEGRPVILAAWRDDGRDGAGVGAFQLAEAATAEGMLPASKIAVRYFLDEEVRRERARTGRASMGSGNPWPLGLALSPDGSHVAVPMAGGVLVWPTAAFIAGQPPAVEVKERIEGLAFDRAGRRVGGRSDDRDQILFWDVDSGAPSKITLEGPKDDFGGVFFGGHGTYVSSRTVRDESGKVIGQLPDEAKGGACVGGALLAIVGDDAKARCVYRIDAATGEVAGKVEAPGAYQAITGREGQFVVVGGLRKTAITLPWPA